MSLTKDDLLAIKNLIDGSIDERVPKIINERVPVLVRSMLQEAIDEVKQHTAGRFVEVHDALNIMRDDIKAVDYKLDQSFEVIKRVEDKLDKIARQTGENTLIIHKMKTALQ